MLFFQFVNYNMANRTLIQVETICFAGQLGIVKAKEDASKLTHPL